MPRLDGTGPIGQGAGSGRRMGFCGSGIGTRMGMGCGCHSNNFGRRRFISPKNELSALEDEEKILKQELEFIKEEKSALKNQ